MTPSVGGMIGARLGAGREADVHAWGNNEAIKLYRPGYRGHSAEALALAKLDGRGGAPKLIDIVECAGRTGLVLERLSGSDMLSLLQQRPWRVLGMASAMARAHLGVHRVQAPQDLPDIREVLAARISHDAELTHRLRDHALRVLDSLPSGDRVCHGDYHPGNVLVDADRLSVIDWVNAARGTPEADHARTVLLLRWADPLPDTPLFSRALITAGRAIFANGYVRTYRHGLPVPFRQVDRWLVVHAAARLAEGIAAERATLIEFLGHAHRRDSS